MLSEEDYLGIWQPGSRFVYYIHVYLAQDTHVDHVSTTIGENISNIKSIFAVQSDYFQLKTRKDDKYIYLYTYSHGFHTNGLQETTRMLTSQALRTDKCRNATATCASVKPRNES